MKAKYLLVQLLDKAHIMKITKQRFEKNKSKEHEKEYKKAESVFYDSCHQYRDLINSNQVEG